MPETVKIWFEMLYEGEIENVKGNIINEHIWELGYEGEEPNPHTENLKVLGEYLEMLEEKLKEVQGK